MWCNAAGQMLPPMVVHGAKKRPSNATHIFQSLEVSVFSPIKKKFKKRTRELEKGILGYELAQRTLSPNF